MISFIKILTPAVLEGITTTESLNSHSLGLIILLSFAGFGFGTLTGIALACERAIREDSWPPMNSIRS